MNLPFLTSSIPPVPAEIKKEPADFIVEEIPYYLPEGRGEHTYLFIEKEGITTHELVSVLAEQFSIKETEIGVAGLKDARAVTRQWVSIRLLPDSALSKLSHPSVRILETGRHNNKLRIGHLKGNRFQIRLRGVAETDIPRIREVFHILKHRGVPNYFGEQRFGSRGDTHLIGKALLEGDVAAARQRMSGPKRRMNFFYMSAYQSFIFNLCLARRIEKLDELLEGDIAFKHENGAVFKVTDPQAELPRLERFEISPTGPVFGPKMVEPEGFEKDLESSVLKEQGIAPDLFQSKQGRLALSGERRPYRIPVQDLVINNENQDLKIIFFLSKGSYATAVLREITK